MPRRCLQHNLDCPLDSTAREWSAQEGSPLGMHVAGVTCKDHSRRNQKAMGLAGPHAPVLATWASERKHALEDVVIVENVESFPTQELEELLAPKLVLAAELVWGPEQMGWWVKRRRKYMIFTRADRPWKARLQDFAEKFESWFACLRPQNCEKGDMFFSTPELVLLQWKRQRCQRRGSRVQHECVQSEAALQSMPWRTLLSEGQCDRLKLYEKLALAELSGGNHDEHLETERRLGEVVASLCQATGRSIIVDLDQHPSHGPSCRNDAVPTLISHGELYSMRQQRSATPEEWMLCQGWPLWDFAPQAIASIYENLPHSWFS